MAPLQKLLARITVGIPQVSNVGAGFIPARLYPNGFSRQPKVSSEAARSITLWGGGVKDGATLGRAPYRARQAIISLSATALGDLRMQEVVPRLSLTPGGVKKPAPESIGRDNEEVLSRLRQGLMARPPVLGKPAPQLPGSPAPPLPYGRGSDVLPRTSTPLPPSFSREGEAPGPSPGQALRGLRVLDLGTGLASNFGAVLLADYGAEVIKVEEPRGKQNIRQVPPYYEEAALLWAINGRNK